MTDAFNNDTDKNSDVSSGPGVVKEVTAAKRSQQPRQPRKINKSRDEMAYYGRSVFMLNRCLDDIEAFGKKLNVYVKQHSNKSEDDYGDQKIIKVPHQDEAVDTVRKIKFSLNTNDEVRSLVPEASEKVFIRLVKFVRWLDDLCRRQVIPDYEANLVRDVIEPLLSESTVISLEEQLSPPLAEFWQQLGPAWSTPAESWPNPLATYMPQFSTTVDHENQSKSWRRSHFESGRSRSGRHVDERSMLTMQPLHVVTRCYSPRFFDNEQKQYFIRLEDRGSRLCYSTVHHVSAKPPELHATQGEVFEVIDSEDNTWWTVKSYTGMTGQLPSWKLRPFVLNRNHIMNGQSEVTDSQYSKLGYQDNRSNTATLKIKSIRKRDSTSGSEGRMNDPFHNNSLRSHSVEHGTHGSTLDDDTGSHHQYYNHQHHHYHHHRRPQPPQTQTSYMTLTDRQDTYRKPATIPRPYRYNSRHHSGTGTYRPYDFSPHTPSYCSGMYNDYDCMSSHPYTCRALHYGPSDPLMTNNLASGVGSTCGYSSSMPRGFGQHQRSQSVDPINRQRCWAGSLERFNSRPSLYYRPTMTLDNKRRHKLIQR